MRPLPHSTVMTSPDVVLRDISSVLTGVAGKTTQTASQTSQERQSLGQLDVTG